MQRELDMVKEFMEKHRQAKGAKLPSHRNVHLETAHAPVVVAASVLEGHIPEGDLRVLRAHLMCEELSEVLAALMEGSPHNLLDGLTDLVYVTLGTAVAFGLPLAEAFDEVHRSNMTKQKALPDIDPRVRVKGTGYEPPDLDGILSKRHPQGETIC